MDLIKIGAYISGKRKELGMTQRQLAEKLGMSDKSVSKWERGICLPDVSVYSDLCHILDISINEFLAGEDIPQECIVEKSEENILGVATDSKRKQKRLKAGICVLLVIAILALAVIGTAVYREIRPQNSIAPLERDSIEMKTAELLYGMGRVHIFKFTTTDEYDYLKIYLSEYHSGQLVKKDHTLLKFVDYDSPEGGEILIVTDQDNAVIKVVIAENGGASYKFEFPILNGEPNQFSGRAWTGLPERTDIRYNEEQALAAFIYDNDKIETPYLRDPMKELSGEGYMAENDVVYYFSFEFGKE